VCNTLTYEQTQQVNDGLLVYVFVCFSLAWPVYLKFRFLFTHQNSGMQFTIAADKWWAHAPSFWLWCQNLVKPWLQLQ